MNVYVRVVNGNGWRLVAAVPSTFTSIHLVWRWEIDTKLLLKWQEKWGSWLSKRIQNGKLHTHTHAAITVRKKFIILEPFAGSENNLDAISRWMAPPQPAKATNGKPNKIPRHLTNFINQSFHGSSLLSLCRHSLRELFGYCYCCMFLFSWDPRINMQENGKNDNSPVFILVWWCCCCGCCRCCCCFGLVILRHFCSSSVVLVSIVLIYRFGWRFHSKRSYQNA